MCGPGAGLGGGESAESNVSERESNISPEKTWLDL